MWVLWPRPHRSILVGVARTSFWLAFEKLIIMSHSVATQTHWSWLKDLEEIARLKKEHGGKLSLEIDSIQQMLDEEQSARDPGAAIYTFQLLAISCIHALLIDLATEEFGGTSSDTDLTLRRDLQISHKRGKEKVVEKTLILPSIIDESEDRSKKLQHAEELVLPPIISLASQSVETNNEENDTISDSMKAVSLSSIDQLEQLTFPFFEDRAAEDGDGESDTEKASDKIEDDEQDSSRSSSTIPVAPRLKLDNLPWPSILQYIRESESLTSEYFSLSNKEAIESRIAHNKRLQRTVTSEEAERLKNYHLMSDKLGESDSESDSMAAKSQICDFCGQSSTQISLLQLAEDQVICIPVTFRLIPRLSNLSYK